MAASSSLADVGLSDAAENDRGQSRLTSGERARGRCWRGRGIRAGHRGVGVSAQPLTFVTEASSNPLLKDHTDIIEGP